MVRVMVGVRARVRVRVRVMNRVRLDMINHGRSWSTVLDQGHLLFNA